MIEPAIYVASKVRHAAMWQDQRRRGKPIRATWIDHADTVYHDMANLWTIMVLEASTASALIVYVEGDEHLKGAFVEVGAALALRVPVFVAPGEDIGDAAQQALARARLRDQIGTWIDHPRVEVCRNLSDAFSKATLVSGVK